MNSIKQIRELNKRELEAGVNPEGSWHVDYRDTAYVYIGGLPFELSEGDIVTIFSQYGEPVYINLVRDKETGKSKGFCFLKYEDQRSCDLAVDNLGGAEVMGRILRVDHTRYKKKDGEKLTDNTGGVAGEEEAEISEDEAEQRPLLKEEVELQELMRNHDDDDPMKAYMIEQKKEELQNALSRLPKAKKSHKEKGKDHRHKSHKSHRHRSRSHDRRKDEQAGKDSNGNGQRSRKNRTSSRERDRDQGDSGQDKRRRRSNSAEAAVRTSRRHRSRSKENDMELSRRHRSRSRDIDGDARRRRRFSSSRSRSPVRRRSRSPRRDRRSPR